VSLHFYGIPDYANEIARPVISCQLEKAIKDYYDTVDQLAQRVRKSYGRLISLGGLDMGNAPLVKAIQEKILADVDKNSEVLGPEGTKWESAGITLADLDKAILPMMEAVAIEAGLPFWLVFGLKSETISQLEERSNYLAAQFQAHVAPTLLTLLRLQGYGPLTLTPPSYRDAFYDATVAGLRQEVELRKATTARNNALARQVEIGNADKLAKLKTGVTAAESLAGLESNTNNQDRGNSQDRPGGSLEVELSRSMSDSQGLTVAKS
jgi:hypothetical protein